MERAGAGECGPMTTKLTALALVPLVVLAAAGTAWADVSPDQVRNALDRAVVYLKHRQDNNGTWPDLPGNVGGVTALCTLALLNAGVPPDDTTIQKSLSYLRTLKPTQTYVVALQTMVFCAAEPKKDRLLIRQCATWLEKHQ